LLVIVTCWMSVAVALPIGTELSLSDVASKVTLAGTVNFGGTVFCTKTVGVPSGTVLLSSEVASKVIPAGTFNLGAAVSTTSIVEYHLIHFQIHLLQSRVRYS